MKRKIKVFDLFLILIFIICIFLISLERGFIHGETVEGDVSSNVSISRSYAVSFSDELSGGIVFEELHVLPAENVSARGNNLEMDNSSSYYVSLSSDSNSAVDLCIKVDGDLRNMEGDFIGYGNETYSSSGFTNSTVPSLENEGKLSLNYSSFASALSPGNSRYLRFWLDVPASQSSGTYYNLVYFKASTSGEGC